jgi:O-antigen/teichoic acid export membrane protein
MFFGIILTPLWSATTEAFATKDFQWIRGVMDKLQSTAIYFAILGIIMLVFANWVYKIWVGNNIEIPYILSITMFIYVIIYLFASPYSSFLNGDGKIKLNFYLVVFQAISFLPYVYIFTKYLNFGVAGIVIASIVSELPIRISQPIQYQKIMNNTATGIWNK